MPTSRDTKMLYPKDAYALPGGPSAVAQHDRALYQLLLHVPRPHCAHAVAPQPLMINALSATPLNYSKLPFSRNIQPVKSRKRAR